MGGRHPWLRATLLAAACAGSGPAAERPSVPASTPDLVLRSPDTATIAFDRIGAVVPAGDGGVVITLPGSRQILIYGGDGRLRQVVGRAGSGPGEFTSLGAVGLRGDTVWAYDPVADRLTLFHRTTGSLVESRRAGLRLPGWPAGVDVLGLLSDGSVLAEGHHSITGLLQGSVPAYVPVAQTTRSGRVVQQLGGRDLGQWSFRTKAEGGEIEGIEPLVAVDRVAVAADGGHFALVRPFQDSVSVTMYDGTARRLYDSALRIAGPPLTTARFDSAMRHLGPPFSSLAPGAIRRPPRLPVVADATIGTDGALWLLLDPPALGRSAARWLVVSPAGVVSDTVWLPASRRLARPDGRRYWAVEVDSLDVPRVVRYRWR